MAADLGAGARAYQEIKRAILSGDLKLRQRLDIDDLAKRWRVSATPVRHALAVLTAERLVSTHPSRGYNVAFWTEAELAALYEWRWQLGRLAVETWRPVVAAPSSGQAHLDAVIEALGRLAGGVNMEVGLAIAAADDRLRAAYRVEPDVLPHVEKELASLNEAIDAGDTKRVLHRLRVYFRRRMADSAAIRARASVTALPRNGD